MPRLYNTHCLPWTLHYTWVCLKHTSAKRPASNDSSLSCGSALSGETVCWPQGHTTVTCLHPWRGRTKINSTNNPKKENISMEAGLFWVRRRGMRNVFGQVWHMKVQEWRIYQCWEKYSNQLPYLTLGKSRNTTL